MTEKYFFFCKRTRYDFILPKCTRRNIKKIHMPYDIAGFVAICQTNKRERFDMSESAF